MPSVDPCPHCNHSYRALVNHRYANLLDDNLMLNVPLIDDAKRRQKEAEDEHFSNCYGSNF